MEYILKLFDVDLIKFKIVENLSDPVLQITWTNEKKKHLLPLTKDVPDYAVVVGNPARVVKMLDAEKFL